MESSIRCSNVHYGSSLRGRVEKSHESFYTAKSLMNLWWNPFLKFQALSIWMKNMKWKKNMFMLKETFCKKRQQQWKRKQSQWTNFANVFALIITLWKKVHHRKSMKIMNLRILNTKLHLHHLDKEGLRLPLILLRYVFCAQCLKIIKKSHFAPKVTKNLSSIFYLDLGELGFNWNGKSRNFLQNETF